MKKRTKRVVHRVEEGMSPFTRIVCLTIIVIVGIMTLKPELFLMTRFVIGKVLEYFDEPARVYDWDNAKGYAIICVNDMTISYYSNTTGIVTQNAFHAIPRNQLKHGTAYYAYFSGPNIHFTTEPSQLAKVIGTINEDWAISLDTGLEFMAYVVDRTADY